MNNGEDKTGENSKRRCSKCKRSTKGHDGPYGSKCTMEVVENDETNSEGNTSDDDRQKSNESAEEKLKTAEEKLKRTI